MTVSHKKGDPFGAEMGQKLNKQVKFSVSVKNAQIWCLQINLASKLIFLAFS